MMALTGTFTFDDLVGMASNDVLEKLLEIRARGPEDEFETEADTIGDWDEIHSMLAGMTVNEFFKYRRGRRGGRRVMLLMAVIVSGVYLWAVTDGLFF